MSDAPPVRAPESLLATVVAILDIVVLERLYGGSFHRLGSELPPSWFAGAFNAVDAGAPATLVQAFPVLDSFLSEAEAFWQRTSYGRLDGEPFVVAGPDGRNLPLTTIAVAIDGRHFLLIQRVAGFDDRQHILQRAREQALGHEAVVRKIDDLRQPLAKLAGLVTGLAASECGEPQRAILSRATSEIEALRTTLDELPKPPSGVSRGGRSRRS